MHSIENNLVAAEPAGDVTHTEIIDRFEKDLVPPDSFHHADHVRLAFAYLMQFPALEALERFSSAVRRFATARGKPGRYHETITYAFFFLIRERMICHGMTREGMICENTTRNGATAWDDFAAANPDLLDWKNSILNRYYDRAVLDSDLARRVFLLPHRPSSAT